MKAIDERFRPLKESPPGRRFQDRYHRNWAKRKGPRGWRRWLKLGGGLAVCLAGVFLMPAPGPGWCVFILGAAMISDEFLFVARALDWAELRVRPVMHWAKTFWRGTSRGGRMLLGLLAAACGAAAAYGTYWWWFG